MGYWASNWKGESLKRVATLCCLSLPCLLQLKLPSAKRQAVNLTVVVTTLGAIDFVVDSSDSKTKKRRKQRERGKRGRVTASTSAMPQNVPKMTGNDLSVFQNHFGLLMMHSRTGARD
jgi:hypothetical protein